MAATKSDDISRILKYIQSKYTVPTNFEKVWEVSCKVGDVLTFV